MILEDIMPTHRYMLNETDFCWLSMAFRQQITPNKMAFSQSTASVQNGHGSAHKIYKDLIMSITAVNWQQWKT